MARLILTLITLDPEGVTDDLKNVLSGMATGLQAQNPDLEVQWVCAINPEDIFTEKILELIN